MLGLRHRASLDEADRVAGPGLVALVVSVVHLRAPDHLLVGGVTAGALDPDGDRLVHLVGDDDALADLRVAGLALGRRRAGAGALARGLGASGAAALAVATALAGLALALGDAALDPLLGAQLGTGLAGERRALAATDLLRGEPLGGLGVRLGRRGCRSRRLLGGLLGSGLLGGCLLLGGGVGLGLGSSLLLGGLGRLLLVGGRLGLFVLILLFFGHFPTSVPFRGRSRAGGRP